MTALDLRALLPLIILGVTPVVVLLVIAIRRSHAASAAITLVGLAAAFWSLWLVGPIAPREVLAQAPMIAVLVWIGFYPQPVLDTFHSAMRVLQEVVK